jgi:hypothetical protein
MLGGLRLVCHSQLLQPAQGPERTGKIAASQTGVELQLHQQCLRAKVLQPLEPIRQLISLGRSVFDMQRALRFADFLVEISVQLEELIRDVFAKPLEARVVDPSRPAQATTQGIGCPCDPRSQSA